MADRGTTREEKDALPTVERLIGIYFPDLEPQLNAVLTSRNKLANLNRSFQGDYRNGLTSNGPWLEPFRKEFILNENIINKLKHDVATHPIKTTQRKSIIP